MSQSDPKVHFHVGMPKCGSTSLQRHFNRFDEFYAKQGICYPESYREPKGYRSHRPFHALPAQDMKPAANEIYGEATRKGCKNILLSSEEILNTQWDKPTVKNMVVALNSVFGPENVRIVYFVRNHHNFVESVYAQYLKGGMYRATEEKISNTGFDGITGFVEYFHRSFGFDVFCFSDMISKIQGAAPENEHSVYSIEKRDLRGEDIVAYIAKDLGAEEFPSAPKMLNRRFSPAALLGLRYALSKYRFEDVRARRDWISKAFSDHPSGFSKILNVTEDLAKRMESAVEKDKKMLPALAVSNLDEVFADRAFPDTQGSPELQLSEQDKELVDAILQAEVVDADVFKELLHKF